MKNIDNVILKTSKDLDISKEKVKIVIDAYWNDIYYKVLNLESTTILIRHVGLITLSKFKLRNFISSFIKKIRVVMDSGDKYSDIKKKQIIEGYKNKVRKALVKKNVIAKEYAEKFKNV